MPSTGLVLFRQTARPHQGIFDPAFLSQVGIPVYSPSNYAELRHWLPILLSDEMQGPPGNPVSPRW